MHRFKKFIILCKNDQKDYVITFAYSENFAFQKTHIKYFPIF